MLTLLTELAAQETLFEEFYNSDSKGLYPGYGKQARKT